MNSTEIAKKLNDAFPHFTGSQTFTKYSPLFNVLLTEGALFVAETASAFWLMDVISSYQGERKFKDEDFQVWELTVNLEKGSGVIVATDGNDNELARQEIPLTDFPLETISLWAERNHHRGITILLPSEH